MDPLEQINKKLDAMTENIVALTKDIARLDAHMVFAVKETDRINKKLGAIDAQMPGLRVDIEKLHVKQSLFSSITGAVMGFIGSKL